MEPKWGTHAAAIMSSFECPADGSTQRGHRTHPHPTSVRCGGAVKKSIAFNHAYACPHPTYKHRPSSNNRMVGVTVDMI